MLAHSTGSSLYVVADETISHTIPHEETRWHLTMKKAETIVAPSHSHRRFALVCCVLPSDLSGWIMT